MTISEITQYIENFAPLGLQESYDNSGLLLGNAMAEATAALICIDVTEEVVDEAIAKGANLIIAHHPLIFSGLKRITGKNYVERTVVKAIKNDIAIYAAHTNADNVWGGVNAKIAEKLHLTNTKVLLPMKNMLRKLVTFVPLEYAEKVRTAIFAAGAGHIGNYDSCSYNLQGQGSFRAAQGANPFVGEIGELHFENEIRVETIYPKTREAAIINAMKEAHPYEEVAYDIYPLENSAERLGAGLVGELETETDVYEFLAQLKQTFSAHGIRYTQPSTQKIKRVALCGGAGSFLLSNAIAAKADIFVSGDFKYHQFFDAENRIIIADIGHYESEQFTKDIFYEIVTKKFTNFAVYLSQINTNPIKYF